MRPSTEGIYRLDERHTSQHFGSRRSRRRRLKKMVPPGQPRFLRLSDLKPFRGIFNWSPKVLLTNIRQRHPNYHVEDPKTWPRISAQHLEFLDGKPYDGVRPLPGGVAAFDDDLMQLMVREKNVPIDYIDASHDGHPQSMHRAFYRYPFYFDQSGHKRLDSEITQHQLETYKEKRRHVRIESESGSASSLPRVGPCVSPPFGPAPSHSRSNGPRGMPTPPDSAAATPTALRTQPSNTSTENVPLPPSGPAPERPPPPPQHPPCPSIPYLTPPPLYPRNFHTRLPFASEERPPDSSSTIVLPQQPQVLSPAHESCAKEGSKLAEQVPFARQGILGYTNALASELNETREAHLNTREMLNAKHDVHLKDLEKLKKANAKIEEIQKQVEAKANEAAEMAQQVETARRVQDELKKDLDGRSKELAERDETIGNLRREQASLQDRLRSAEKERDQSYRETLALWKGVKETALANGVKVTALTEPVLDCIQHNFEPEAEGRKRKADDATCAEGDVPMGSRKVREKFRIGQAEV